MSNSRRNIIPYNPKLKEYARRLRKNSTSAEINLWNCLRKKQLSNYDFHRQKPLDQFIVDFFCSELMLAIEIDGCTHNYKMKDDDSRQKRLESLGVRFLRYTEFEVKSNLQGVVTDISQWIKKHTPP